MRDTVGIVFDIEEFAVFDGPGIRVAVFLKGCPLRCQWCHNPEGLKPRPERAVTKSLCTDCGRCREICPTPDMCTACGMCVPVCPNGAIKIVGTPMSASAVAERVLRHAKVLALNGGGVTFSGGEALLQLAFVEDVADRLPGVHRAIETCGFASEGAFLSMISRMDLVMMDIKLVDTEEHRRWTGVSNELILKNLGALIRSGVPFRSRVPVIPGVNDRTRTLKRRRAARRRENLERVELLRYNRSRREYGLREEYRRARRRQGAQHEPGDLERIRHKGVAL